MLLVNGMTLCMSNFTAPEVHDEVKKKQILVTHSKPISRRVCTVLLATSVHAHYWNVVRMTLHVPVTSS